MSGIEGTGVPQEVSEPKLPTDAQISVAENVIKHRFNILGELPVSPDLGQPSKAEQPESDEEMARTERIAEILRKWEAGESYTEEVQAPEPEAQPEPERFEGVQEKMRRLREADITEGRSRLQLMLDNVRVPKRKPSNGDTDFEDYREWLYDDDNLQKEQLDDIRSDLVYGDLLSTIRFTREDLNKLKEVLPAEEYGRVENRAFRMLADSKDRYGVVPEDFRKYHDSALWLNEDVKWRDQTYADFEPEIKEYRERKHKEEVEQARILEEQFAPQAGPEPEVQSEPADTSAAKSSEDEEVEFELSQDELEVRVSNLTNEVRAVNLEDEAIKRNLEEVKGTPTYVEAGHEVLQYLVNVLRKVQKPDEDPNDLLDQGAELIARDLERREVNPWDESMHDANKADVRAALDADLAHVLASATTQDIGSAAILDLSEAGRAALAASRAGEEPAASLASETAGEPASEVEAAVPEPESPPELEHFAEDVQEKMRKLREADIIEGRGRLQLMLDNFKAFKGKAGNENASLYDYRESLYDDDNRKKELDEINDISSGIFYGDDLLSTIRFTREDLNKLKEVLSVEDYAGVENRAFRMLAGLKDGDDVPAISGEYQDRAFRLDEDVKWRDQTYADFEPEIKEYRERIHKKVVEGGRNHVKKDMADLVHFLAGNAEALQKFNNGESYLRDFVVNRGRYRLKDTDTEEVRQRIIDNEVSSLLTLYISFDLAQGEVLPNDPMHAVLQKILLPDEYKQVVDSFEYKQVVDLLQARGDFSQVVEGSRQPLTADDLKSLAKQLAPQAESPRKPGRQFHLPNPLNGIRKIGEGWERLREIGRAVINEPSDIVADIAEVREDLPGRAVQQDKERIEADNSPYRAQRQRLAQILNRIEEVKGRDWSSMTLEDLAGHLTNDTKGTAGRLHIDRWQFAGNAEALREEIVGTLIDSRYGPEDEGLKATFGRLDRSLVEDDAMTILDQYGASIIVIINNLALRSDFANPADAKWLNEHREFFKVPGQASVHLLVEGDDEEWQAWMDEANKNIPENKEKERMLLQAETERLLQEQEGEKQFREFEEDLRGKKFDEAQLPQRLVNFEMVLGDRVHEALKENLTFNQYQRVISKFFELIDAERNR